ncbi:MAG: DNA-binding protein [Deltaproteobacteria bacterium CG11_big_fil_rev_8_21_14_0_20_47_16]|nr:MAG: DNA-binding protein [Deltaproteobacteria bacterium CG11_big_fil_rev_8_21_14_0_20_47_16]
MTALLPEEHIEQKILLIRGHKVMLDSDLATLYGVPTKRLNEQVRRNIERFPEDFMFSLNNQEVALLRSQIATLKVGRGEHRKYIPYVFTEQGVAMLSSVLNSRRAIQVNIEIMRTFVKLRQLLINHKDLAKKLHKMEKGYDQKFKVVFDALRQLMTPPTSTSKRKIGFL